MPVSVERVVELSSERSQLWCAIGDTERMNRAVGLGPLAVSPNEGASAARYVVRTVSGGFPLEYEEQPFEWVENEHFRIHRSMRSGVLLSMTNEFWLTPRAEGGTSVRFRLSVEPRWQVLGPVLKLELLRFAGRIASELGRVEQDVKAGRTACFRTGTSAVDEASLSRSARALEEHLAPERRELGQKLVEYLRTAPDSDVVRIRPFELATLLQADDRETLAVCLHAVKAGLVELHWELVCPSCRTGTESTDSLSDLPAAGHCQLCDLSFELELDRAVEATFRPKSSLRALASGPYCIGGPFRTPHVVTQALLDPGGKAELRAPEEAGRYRLFLRGGATTALEVALGGDAELVVQSTDTGLSLAKATLAPSARLEIQHAGEKQTHVKLERLVYASRAATAHVVSTLPEFRRYFSSDLLRPGTTLRVARVALLFTDLTDSTALYSRVGDAKAFKVVHEHFDLLLGIISAHRGTLVKTIGDAVMAAFVEERDAIAASIEMLERFPEFRGSLPEAGRTFLKVGVYAGPCYVVTANGILDYFGQTVNTAARLQGAAGAGEVLLVEDLADEANEQGWLGSHTPSERFEASLKGLDAPLRVARIHVDRSER
ncbi:MAG: adenylate/guanylate cyclase domain-containing protein [Myxococcales bacterium]|nr:MAG: adenylate/guanylate cyclase domain-containing protein [Myxococcales bacterium]